MHVDQQYRWDLEHQLILQQLASSLGAADGRSSPGLRVRDKDLTVSLDDEVGDQERFDRLAIHFEGPTAALLYFQDPVSGRPEQARRSVLTLSGLCRSSDSDSAIAAAMAPSRPGAAQDEARQRGDEGDGDEYNGYAIGLKELFEAGQV